MNFFRNLFKKKQENNLNQIIVSLDENGDYDVSFALNNFEDPQQAEYLGMILFLMNSGQMVELISETMIDYCDTEKDPVLADNLAITGQVWMEYLTKVKDLKELSDDVPVQPWEVFKQKHMEE